MRKLLVFSIFIFWSNIMFAFSISPVGEEPSVAFNGELYFVVWEDSFTIYGSRIKLDGTILDTGGFTIISGFNSRHPKVDSDGTDFLVVWQDSRNGNDDIWGCRVQNDGTILEPGGFVISDNDTEEFNPVLSYNGTNYFVVWQRYNGNYDWRGYPFSDIYGARVNSSGLVIDINARKIGNSTSLVPSDYTMCSNGDNYFVLFQRGAFGVIVNADGTVSKTISINTSASAGYPSVSFDGANYFVAFGKMFGNIKIYGTMIQIDGTVLDTDGVHLITTNNEDANFLRMPFLFNGINYLLIWEEFYGYYDRFGVHGQYDINTIQVDTEGNLIDTEIGRITNDLSREQQTTAIFGKNNYLLVWKDADGGIMGKIININNPPNSPVNIVVNNNPNSGQSISDTTPTVSWTFTDPDVGDTQGAYNIKLSTDAFVRVIYEDTQITNDAFHTVLPGLTVDGTYWIKIRTQDNNGAWGEFSDGSDSFILDTIPPTVPVLDAEPTLTPGTKNTVSWTASYDTISGVAGYFIECSEVSDFSTISDSSGWLSDTSYTFTGLGDGAIYYYRVTAKDYAENISDWSDSVWSKQDNTAATYIISASPDPVTAAGAVTVIVTTSETLATAPQVLVTQNGPEYSNDITATMTTTDGITWTGIYNAITNYDGVAKIDVSGTDLVGYVSKGSGAFLVGIGPAGANIIISNVSDSPNTFSPRLSEITTIYYTLSTSGGQIAIDTTTITFENENGEVVDTYVYYNQVAGNYEGVWTGKEDNDTPFSDGVYTYRLNVAGRKITGPKSTVVNAIEKVGKITILGMAELDTIGVIISNPSNAVIKTTPTPDGLTASSFGIQDGAVGAIYDIQPTGTEFSPAATLTLYYNDRDNDGIVDGTSIEETTIDIYRYIPDTPAAWQALGGTVDPINNKISVAIDHLSIYTILSSAAVFGPIPEIDKIGPTFEVILRIDSENTAELTVIISTSEPLQSNPEVTVYPHGRSPNKESVKVSVTLIAGTDTQYAGIFSRITGFGDINKIIVIGKDLAGNVGQSEGSFTKEVVSSQNGVKVCIPQGATSDTEMITIVSEDESDQIEVKKKDLAIQKQELKPIGKGYEFGPGGLSFKTAVTISIPYDEQETIEADENELRIYTWNKTTASWELIETSRVYPDENIVAAEVPHFSLYKIMAPTLKASWSTKNYTSNLLQNYPNPFNPETWIPFTLGERAQIVIKIYSISGRLIRTLDLGELDIGEYISPDKAAYWDGRDENGEEVASGVYFYRLQVGTYVSIRRMVVLK